MNILNKTSKNESVAKLPSPENFIKMLKRDFSQFDFKPGDSDHWSPRTNTISYYSSQKNKDFQYGILHELAHALLDHTNYSSDFELLKMESLAWHKAAQIGRRYGIKISEEYIQNCLDTYRDWLHRRSSCPVCKNHSLQINKRTYRCFNCQSQWQVSLRRFARPYRLNKTS